MVTVRQHADFRRHRRDNRIPQNNYRHTQRTITEYIMYGWPKIPSLPVRQTLTHYTDADTTFAVSGIYGAFREALGEDCAPFVGYGDFYVYRKRRKWCTFKFMSNIAANYGYGYVRDDET